MSQYTTTIKRLIENDFNFGLNQYPIFSENYRGVLNAKILEEYFFREIGYDMPEMFANRLRHRLNMIMPKYNEMYKLAQIKFDPLIDTIRKEEQKRDSKSKNKVQQTSEAAANSTSGTTGEITSKSTNGGNSLSVSSDTPANLITRANLDADFYANNAVRSENSDNSEGSSKSRDNTETKSFSDSVNKTDGSGESTEQFIISVSGLSGARSQTALLVEYRDSLINIDQMVISELSDLFMGVW